MKIILLPGNSPVNRDWIEKLEIIFKKSFDKVEIQYYKHWHTGEDMVDIEYESRELSRRIGKSIIFAKSIGVGVALKAISDLKIKPDNCIFVGTPIMWCRGKNIPIEKWLKKLNIPSLFIQQNEDPTASFEILKESLRKNNIKNCEIKCINGNDHMYNNFEELEELIRAYI